MFITDDVHRQFAEFFDDRTIWPYAYLLSKKLAEGNVCVDLSDTKLFEGTTPYVDIAPVDKVMENKQLVSIGPTILNTPFIYFNHALYLQRYFIYETICIEKIKALIHHEEKTVQERKIALLAMRDLVQSLQATYAIQGLPNEEQTDWQLAAVLQALLNNFSIITGGPGTGKTTTLAKLLILLFEWQPFVKVALAAPTGKAAMRMHDALKNSVIPYSATTKQKIQSLKPSTLHSLLGYHKDAVSFKYHASNPLPYDWVIVDEASMIDLPMFAKLLDALGPTTRILLLGDKDQLASVEAGSLLGDLCASLPQLSQFREGQLQWINQFISDQARTILSTHITQNPTLLTSHILELQYSHRFNSMGAIGKLSRAVITSNLEALQACINIPNDQIVFYEALQNEAINEIAKSYSAYLQEPDTAKALRLFNEQRILVAVRAGAQGLYTVNKIIEEQLKKMNLIKPDAEFYENKPVMVTRNRYDLGLFNGDVGIIRKDSAGVLKVWFDEGNGSLKSVLPAYLSNYETVYAMTIHKSQGSEFEKVMLVLPQGVDMPLLTRELLYTAITRAKSKLLIVGAMTTIIQAAQASVHRISGIKNRMEGLKPEEGSV